jgi:hypothetical protein
VGCHYTKSSSVTFYIHSDLLKTTHDLFLLACYRSHCANRGIKGDINISYTKVYRSLDSVVGIVTRYGMDNRGVGVLSPVRVKNFLHIIQTGSGGHPASYPMGLFPRQ